MAWNVAVVGAENIETRARVLGWLRNLVVAMFAVAILAGMFLPVYTDEIGWRFQERAGLDGVDKLFSDNCGPNTLARPPFFMMPARYYSAFFNTLFADPFYVRVSGVLYALLWGVLLLALIRRLSPGRSDRAALPIVGIGLMCLGTMPLLLVWSRPEQPILLATTAALLLALGNGPATGETSARTSWRRSVTIFVLAAIAFSYHLKAFFLAPVFLACLFFAGHGRASRPSRLAMSALLVGMAVWSAHYWIHRLQCPGDPVLLAKFAQNSMGVDLMRSRNGREFLFALREIAGNVTLLDYFGLPAPRIDPLSYWLEFDQLSTAYSFFWFRALVAVWFGALLLALACVVTGVREAWRERRLDPRLVLAAMLLATVLAWSATQAFRNVYEASFVLPLVMLAAVLAIAARGPGQRIAHWFDVMTVIIGVCALASPIAVAKIYAPSLARARAQQGYLAAQPFSVSAFGYARLERDIRGAARQCGIGDPIRARALMVDDLTYFAFMKSPLPQHQLGVVGQWKGAISDPVAYLKSRGSTGVIVGCHLLPDDLRQRARRQGAFCCLGPQSW